MKGKIRNDSISVILSKIPHLLLGQKNVGKIVNLLVVKTSRNGPFRDDRKSMHIKMVKSSVYLLTLK